MKCDVPKCKSRATNIVLSKYLYDKDGKPLCCVSTNRCTKHTRQLVDTIKRVEGKEFHVQPLLGDREKVQFT